MTEHNSSPHSSIDKRPKWKQLAWMIGGGIVLAVGGCGFFLQKGMDSWGGGVGAIAFLIGVLLCLAGCVRWLFGLARRNSSDNN